ncbi:MAG: rhodanese-like domain-containing protein [Methanomicrobiales archaeon]
MKNVTPQEAFDIIEKNYNNPDFIIIDVRTATEFNECHIKGSILLDYYSNDFKKQLNELDKDKLYVVYCRSGVRSKNAMEIMHLLGFQDVCNVLGGILRWIRLSLPTSTL